MRPLLILRRILRIVPIRNATFSLQGGKSVERALLNSRLRIAEELAKVWTFHVLEGLWGSADEMARTAPVVGGARSGRTNHRRRADLGTG